MEVHTAHALLPVSAEGAFAYLSDIARLPDWATEFVQGAYTVEDGVATAETVLGEVTIRLRADPATGVVDHVVEPEPGVEAVFPARVVPVEPRRSLFLFTAIQGPKQDVGAFREEMASLERELQALPERFVAR